MKEATVNVPGSKSYTNRALLIAAMSPLPVKLYDPLLSDDTEAMLACLGTLGIKINRYWNAIEVTGNIEKIKSRNYTLPCNLSGTTMRFMLALSSIIPGTQMLTGGPGLLKRPIGDLVDALRNLGAEIEYLENDGYPPLRVTSSSLIPLGTVSLNASTSSQYLSALLIIAPKTGMTIQIKDKLISKPYADMTIYTMAKFAVSVLNHDYKVFEILPGQTYDARTTMDNINYEVEGDISSACYFWAIAALTKSTITVEGVPPESKQADMGFLKILEEMGNEITYNTRKKTITLKGKGVHAVNVDMSSCPDQAQTLAVLAAFAEGTTTISGIQSLRVKETERIKALENELSKMGIKSSSTKDTLTIHGGSPKPASIDTYGDHRMAMSFAVATTKLPGIVIQNPEVVSKTFPGFWKELSKVTGRKSNIVLIGMRGSGKTTTARLLSQRLDRELLDLDSLIRAKSGSSISEIIEKHGWDYFRDQESSVAEEVSNTNQKIISTGGGIVLRAGNIDALKKNGFVVFLKASRATMIGRLGDMSDRPPLTDQKSISSEIEQLLEERQKLYEATADAIIDTDNLEPEKVVEQIMTLTKDQSA